MIDYRYLKAFLAASRHLSFSKAAKELRISVSALSRQIALLEQGSGQELFIRNTRQVMLTPAGRKLFASVERFEQELTGLEAEMPLRIGCLQSVFEFVLAELIERNLKVFDGPLDIVIGTPETLQEKAASGELDLVLTNQQPVNGSPHSGFRLYQESLTWVGDSARTRERSASRRTIVFSAFEHAYPEEALRDQSRIRVNSFNATLEMTKRKIGRALVALPARGDARKAAQGSQWIYLVVPNYRRMPERLSKVVGLLRRGIGLERALFE